MSAPETDKFCNCLRCGYQWIRGQSGAHSCADYLEKSLASSQSTIADLTRENERLCTANSSYEKEVPQLRHSETMIDAHRIIAERDTALAEASQLRTRVERLEQMLGRAVADDLGDPWRKDAREALTTALHESETKRVEAEQWQEEIRGAIQRSGLGIMRTSQGPSGTMIGNRPEVDEFHHEKELELIRENIDLKVQLQATKPLCDAVAAYDKEEATAYDVILAARAFAQLSAEPNKTK